MEKYLLDLPITAVHPYEKNPRKNDQAVPAVKESIIQTGYIAPIIVDEDNVILAGHTRYKALTELGYKTIEVMRVCGLTEEQKKKYRLLDNKTAEFSSWDLDLLEWELDGIHWDGFDFGFAQPSDVELAEPSEPKEKEIQCPYCGEMFIP